MGSTRRTPSAPRSTTSGEPVEVIITPNGVEVSRSITALPFPLRWFMIKIYVEMLDPGDDFVSRFRKLTTAFTLVASLGALGLVVLNATSVSITTPAAYVACFADVLFTAVSACIYVMLRWNKISTEAAANLGILSGQAFFLSLIISQGDFGGGEAVLLFTVMTLLMRSRLLPLQMLMWLAIKIVFDVNSASFARGAPEITPWALPGFIMRDFTIRLQSNIAGNVFAAFFISAVWLQITESDRQAKIASLSVQLAREVSDQLGKYNTVAARETLTQASANKEYCDNQLISQFHILLDNLDKYRPHLPNWLLATSSDEDDMADFHQSASLKRSDRESSSSQAARRQNQGIFDSTSEGQTSTQSDKDKRNEGLVFLHNGVANFANVTVAIVDFTLPDPMAPSSLLTDARDAVNEWVSWVHREAGHTAAAVHGFVGDMVQLSWNAASRAVQSEAKAARFLARAARHGREHGLRLHGAAMSGKARIQLAGGERVQALTISGAWMRGLVEMRKIGQRLGAMVVDHRTRGGSHFAVQYRAAAALEMMMCDRNDEPQRRAERDEAVAVAAAGVSATSAGDGTGQAIGDVGRGSGTRIGVFEVMRELQDDEGGEWMYVLQGREVAAQYQGTTDLAELRRLADANAEQTQALQMWCDGDGDPDAVTRLSLACSESAALPRALLALFS